jgi:chaperone required for assembly of F1-ATPase
LDERALRTPAGAVLIAPTLPLAELIAEDWARQGPTIDLAGMGATRLAYSAVDRIGRARAETAAEIGRFAGADVVCYFADAPAALVERQSERWGRMLEWAHADLGLEFVRVRGLVHRPQSPETIAAVEALALAMEDFGLAGLAMATALFGSAVLGLALARGRLDGLAAFELSRLDEAFQEEIWGVDEIAAARRARLAGEAGMLDRWFAALR